MTQGPIYVVERKDRGRTSVILTSFAPNTAISPTVESIFAIQSLRGFTTLSGTINTYPVTSGLTFRIEAISFTIRATAATATSLVVSLRVNPTGTVTTTSNPLCVVALGVPATAQSVASISIPIADGLEVPAGGGAQLGVSTLQSTGSVCALSVNIIGFEY
jgi:hypothetical protein